MSNRIRCWCGEIYDSSRLLESHIVVDHMRGWLRYECIYCKMNHSGKTEKATEHQLCKHIEDVHPGEKFQILSTPDIERENELKNMMERSIEILSETTFDQMANCSQPNARSTPMSSRLPNIFAHETFHSPVNMPRPRSVKAEPIKVETGNDVMILPTPSRCRNIFEIDLEGGEASADNSTENPADKNICQICVKHLSLKRPFETDEVRINHAKSHASRDSAYETRNGSLTNFMNVCFPLWYQNDWQKRKSPDPFETNSRKRSHSGRNVDKVSKHYKKYCRKCKKNVTTTYGGMAFHFFDVHIKENTIMCGYCDFGVPILEKQLVAHQQKEHKGLEMNIIDKRSEYSKRYLEERESCFGIPLSYKAGRFPEWFDKSLLE